MSEEDSLCGMKVMIRRTDGRTHPAVIARIHESNNSVIVEWFEDGETKGKEIDYEVLLDMNTHLRPKLGPTTGRISLLPTKLSRDSSVSWEEDGEEDNDFSKDPSDADNGNIKEARAPVNSLPNPRMSSTKPSVPVSSIKGRTTSQFNRLTNTNGHLDGVKESSSTPSLIPKAKGVENIPPTPHLYHAPSKMIPPAPAPQESTGGKYRKSNTVKEVEKLKHNREVRRQKQAEKKEEKEALMNMDPGNPNWQFLAMIREYQSQIDIRTLKESDPVETHQITVCVRKRPLNRKENNRKEIDVITVPRKDLIVVHEPKNKVDLTKYLENQQFRFDYAFDESCSNELVYKYTAKPLVETIFEGGMATCFAYGQTGSGKTHTMGGTFTGKQQDCKNGIYAMVAKDVFRILGSPSFKPLNLVVTSSFFEIYSGKVFDLLAEKAKLRVLEDGKQQVQIIGLTEKVVHCVNEVLQLINAGNQARTSGQTSANSNSSRSHAVFQITLRSPGSHKIHGKFSLIDLAGNERGADTSSADRLTRMEGAEINKSLLALKECIRALGRKGRAHLPFRASKLTQVLRDSFIGENSRTCMIAMISPGMSSCEHSLNTLRYADRVKELAATDPTMDTGESIVEPEREEPEREDDLAALRSLNEHEISADLYNFHEAVSQLQLLEDEVVDGFRNWSEQNDNLTNKEKTLLAKTQVVDYDQEEFATNLIGILSERKALLEPLLQKALAFDQLLRAEEEMSKKMNS